MGQIIWPKREKELALQWWRQGLSGRAIIERLKVQEGFTLINSHTTMYKYLKEWAPEEYKGRSPAILHLQKTADLDLLVPRIPSSDSSLRDRYILDGRAQASSHRESPAEDVKNDATTTTRSTSSSHELHAREASAYNNNNMLPVNPPVSLNPAHGHQFQFSDHTQSQLYTAPMDTEYITQANDAHKSEQSRNIHTQMQDIPAPSDSFQAEIYEGLLDDYDTDVNQLNHDITSTSAAKGSDLLPNSHSHFDSSSSTHWQNSFEYVLATKDASHARRFVSDVQPHQLSNSAVWGQVAHSSGQNFGIDFQATNPLMQPVAMALHSALPSHMYYNANKSRPDSGYDSLARSSIASCPSRYSQKGLSFISTASGFDTDPESDFGPSDGSWSATVSEPKSNQLQGQLQCGAALHPARRQNQEPEATNPFMPTKPLPLPPLDEFASGAIDPNSRDVYGRTPLHYACSRGSMALTRTLLQRGANVHARDNNGIGVIATAYAALEDPGTLLEAYPSIDHCILLVRHAGGVHRPTAADEAFAWCSSCQTARRTCAHA